MISTYIKASLLLFSLLLSACGGNAVTKPAVILDAENYTNNGLLAFSKANWKTAHSSFSKALQLYEGIDQQQGILYSHINLAEVALSTADYSATQSHLDYAANIAKITEFQHYQARITLLLAQSAIRQQNYIQAKKGLQSLLPEFNELTLAKSPDLIQLTAIASRTRVAFGLQRDESLWTQRYTKAFALSDIHSLALESRLLRFQADLLQREQNYKDAESHLKRALSGYKEIPSRSGIAATLAELGRLSMAQGNWHNAQDYLTRSNRVFRYIGDIDQVIRNTGDLAEVEVELDEQLKHAPIRTK